MRANHAKRRLAAGEPSIGTWLSLPSPEAAEYVSRLGFDWLVVDAEHNPIDIRTLAQMFAAMAASDSTPMVRIPWNSGENFKRVLDAGAWGVVVPMVKTREEAERAVEAARFYPEGDRSVGGGRAAMSFETSGEQYLRNANNEILLVLQIEHITGVENADAILSVPGVDACFIGPNDLAASMGIGLGVPLESDNPRPHGGHRRDQGRLPAQRRRPRHPLLRRRRRQPAHRRGLPVLRAGQRAALHAGRPAGRHGGAQLVAFGPRGNRRSRRRGNGQILTESGVRSTARRIAP